MKITPFKAISICYRSQYQHGGRGDFWARNNIKAIIYRT